MLPWLVTRICVLKISKVPRSSKNLYLVDNPSYCLFSYWFLGLPSSTCAYFLIDVLRLSNSVIGYFLIDICVFRVQLVLIFLLIFCVFWIRFVLIFILIFWVFRVQLVLIFLLMLCAFWIQFSVRDKDFYFVSVLSVANLCANISEKIDRWILFE